MCDRHFIDDPINVVNVKPDFEGMGEIIPHERNCIIIDGHCYVLREPKESEESICRQCAFDKTCQEMIEWPLCEMIHKIDHDSKLIYVEVTSCLKK